MLDAEKKSGRNIVVTFNYRYSPKHQTIKELLMKGTIGKVSSVDFSWYLDTRHGADYFRRWHRLRSKGGSLWVHKATHHFDLVNWWLDADPVQVSAFGSLQQYGKSGPFRHTTCRGCPHQSKCPYYWDITKDKNLTELYVGLRVGRRLYRDGCVFKEDIDIFDTMNAIVRYSNGVNMSYSVNTFMPIEGYRVAFNGTKGRIEVRDYERQPWEPGQGHRDVPDQELRQAREDRADGIDRGRPRRRRHAVARSDFPQGRRAGAHAAAEFAGRRHVVPHRDRGAQEHRREPSDSNRRPGEVHVMRFPTALFERVEARRSASRRG